uniref:NADH-ubiquinone oxidoreductase chain 2 n=1 Tax=Brachymeria sp. ZJUH_2016006 TaxID=2491152 RepID=A0A3S8V0F7_9HYME|nr:NADH dehydrogenase subunit 2 [Brachymeria sp. ZJUH_2016006]
MYLNYYNYILFFPMILISSMMIFISESWFSMWMIMEINMISFIMFMNFDKMKNFSNLLNYYFVQTLNSYLFLMFSFLLIYFNYLNDLFYMMMIFSMLVKIGIWPFYLWLKNLIYNMNWITIFIILSIQKLIPMYILLMIFQNFLNIWMFLILMINLFYSSFMGLSMSNFKMLIIYSSMIQNSWMIFMMIINENLFLKYFIYYLLIMMNLCMILNMMNMNKMNNYNYLFLKNKKLFFLMNFMILSLAGIPPFFGFSLKIIAIDMFKDLNLMYYSIFMILISVMSMFFYIRMILLNILMIFLKNKLNWFNLFFFEKIKFNIIYLNLFMLLLFFIFMYL